MPKAPKQHRKKQAHPERTLAPPRGRAATPGPLATCQLVTAERQHLRKLFGPAIRRQPASAPPPHPAQRQEDSEEDDVLQGRLSDAEPQIQRQDDETPADNLTGMPDPLKAGIEKLSGVDLSGVRVHRNSAKPAHLNALAYTQGQDIHLGPGQERHLPHEGWHSAQQMQGRVKPTMQMKSGVDINDDADLEDEADAMGENALQMQGGLENPKINRSSAAPNKDVRLVDTVRSAVQGPLSAPAWQPDPAPGETIQLLRTTSANIAANWNYGGGDPSYTALTVALAGYEAAKTVANAETLIYAAKAFRALGGLSGRTTHHLGVLINELYAERGEMLRADADRDRPATAAEQGAGPVRNATEDERIVGAASVLGSPARQAEERDILRFRAHRGFLGHEMPGVANGSGPAILQNWTARGDMYHVGAVLNLFPNLKVIIYDIPAPTNVTDEASQGREIENARRWKQACAISGYYQQPDRVFYTHADGVAALCSKSHAYDFQRSEVSGDRAAQRDMFIDVGGCTTILGLTLQHARSRGIAEERDRRRELKEAVGPAPAPGDTSRADAAEIQQYLARNGWQTDTPYVIINFRASGHAQIERQLRDAPSSRARARVRRGYDPARDQEGGNHPDLDTGVLGVRELAEIVRARGFTPVFMGEEPADAPQPNLIKYWGFQHDYRAPGALAPERLKLCRGGRAAESYFLRILAETYNVKLLAMRSGVTDQLAMLGIPVISIDIDNFHQAAVPELLAQPGYQVGQDEVAHSWARGSKLEAGLERDYGRVFIQEPRDPRSFGRDDHKWMGGFRRRDKARIDDAVGFYFGTAAASADPHRGIRHSSHPLHPDKLRATASKGRAHRRHLADALRGKLDTGLNPDVALRHAQVLLEAPAPNVAEADKFVDDLLERMRPSRDAVATGDIDHRARQVRQYRELLTSAETIYITAGQNGRKYRTLIDRLDAADALNRERFRRLRAAWNLISRQRDLFDSYFGREGKAKKLANQVRMYEQIAQPQLDRELERAERAVTAEGRAAFHARLLPLAQQTETLYSDLLRVAQQAEEQHKNKDRYYARQFEKFKENLEAIENKTADQSLA